MRTSIKFTVAWLVLSACGNGSPANPGIDASVADAGTHDAALHVDADATDASRDSSLDATPATDASVADDAATADGAITNPSGITADFRSWLAAHGYADDDFARDDLAGGSFGGRVTSEEGVAHTPVIFVHGNSDKALGTTFGQTGWTASVTYFKAHGYTDAELYGTTWGPADSSQASAQTHSKPYLTRIRRFIEAVLAYTGASHVSVISHSMGVTLARKAILGGMSNDPDHGGTFDLGAPLTSSIDTFIGIAGANLGLASCYSIPSVATCNATNGFYPGTLSGFTVTGRSAYLDNLAATSGYEGAFRFSILTTADDIIGFGDIVYGAYTSEIPAETGEKIYSTLDHFGAKDSSADVQFQMITTHTVP